MRPFTWRILLAALILHLIPEYEAATPLFLQAITSALATIPFTGGPMTTGLVGAKLAIGTKLLYFLGFFGRKSSRSKSATSAAPKAAPKVPPQAPLKPPSGGGSFGGGLQPVPLPYLSGGGGGFPMGGFGSQSGFYPPNSFGGGGIDSAQLFQALRAQGMDANTAMQIMNYGGSPGGFGNMPQGGGFGGGFGNVPQGFANGPQGGFGGGFGNVPQGFGNGLQGGGFGGGFGNLPQGGGFGNTPQGFGNVPQGGGFGNVPQDFSQGFLPNHDEMQNINNVPGNGQSNSDQPSETDETPGGASEDVESFFTFLKEMDENTCISRLVCDIGKDPAFLGDFSQNIHGIVGSLDVQPSSGAYPYIAIMETGKREGGCSERFPACDDAAYEIVKNVAPSVGVPEV